MPLFAFCDIISSFFRKSDDRPASGGEESPDGTKQGTPRKRGHESASVQTLFPHVEFETGSELTEFESYRDERE